MEYDWIAFCCGPNPYIVEGEYGVRNTIDTKTGMLIDDYFHDGHGGGSDDEYLYDPDKNMYWRFQPGDYIPPLFQEYSPEEFLDSLHITHLLAVRSINSELVKSFEVNSTLYYNLEDAYAGKYAVAQGLTFLTDFIYDYDVWNWQRRLSLDGVIVVMLGNKSGVVDANGSVVAPFIFDDINLIDNETAFARIDGKYGILDITETAVLQAG